MGDTLKSYVLFYNACTTDSAGPRAGASLSELSSFTLIGGELKVVGELKFSFFAILRSHFT